jgi:hypothetical protein
MSARFSLIRALPFLGALAVLALSACDNQYGPPVGGKPLNWGQQHYLDNQRYKQLNQDRID